MFKYFVLFLFISCNLNNSGKINAYKIDSSIYHPIQSDNITQITPYWKVHLSGTKVWMTIFEFPKDSIVIFYKK